MRWILICLFLRCVCFAYICYALATLVSTGPGVDLGSRVSICISFFSCIRADAASFLYYARLVFTV